MKKKSLVIYDGDCGICQKFKNLITKLDWVNSLNCQPLQNTVAYQAYNVTKEECEKALQFINPSNQIFSGASAVAQICFRLPLLIPLGIFLWLPLVRNLAQWGYEYIAKNRKKISSSCGLTPDKSDFKG